MKGTIITNLTRSGYIHIIRPVAIDTTLIAALRKFRTRKMRNSVQIMRIKSMPEERELVIKRHQLFAATDNKPTFGQIVIPDYSVQPADWTNIARVGCELEGGWTDPATTIHGDGSVDVSMNDDEGTWCEDCDETHYNSDSMPYTGEAHTYPTPYNASDSKAKSGDDSHPLWKQFLEYYPEKVNATCGLHVHVSMKTAGAYSAFVNDRFQPWLLDGLKQWANKTQPTARDHSYSEHYNSWDAMYNRIALREGYCSGKYEPTIAQEQINTRDKGSAPRYTAVNYCYGVHGTFEVRVLPMFNHASLALDAVKELLRLVQVWDNANSPRFKRPMPLATTVGLNPSLTAEVAPHIYYRNCGCDTCTKMRAFNISHNLQPTEWHDGRYDICPYQQAQYMD